jgi:hypothetical protein
MAAGSPTNDQAIEALRVRRAELYESMSALEQALAAPAPGRLDAWAERVQVALVELVSDFREHIAIARDRMGCIAAYLAPRRGCQMRWLVSPVSTPRSMILSTSC